MTSMKRWSAVSLMIAGAALGAACTRHVATEKASRPVRVEKVAAEAAADGLRYSATIQPYEQVQVAFKVGGYVRELRQVAGPDGATHSLQQGDPVARGTVLARLNTADYDEKVNQAKAQLAESEANLARARADFARAESLYEGRALTRPDYDAASAGLEAAVARAEAGRAQLETAQIGLRDSVLVAPADGIVLSRGVEVGTLANPGSVGFVIADLARVKAVFGVPDKLVREIQVGTPFAVTSDAFGAESFPGRVTAVAAAADAQSRVFAVEVTIPNPNRQLKAGMIATVEVAARGASEVAAGSPMVSVAAVVKSAKPGSFAVFVADGSGESNTARAREITLGRISGNRVAVTSGLTVGERVIVSGASLLIDGDRVRVIPGSEGE